MKAKIKIITTAQITALALLLGGLGSSFAEGPALSSIEYAVARQLLNRGPRSRAFVQDLAERGREKPANAATRSAELAAH
jgi:hypothetical protein